MRTRRGIVAGAVLLGLFAGGCFFPPEEPEPSLCIDEDDDAADAPGVPVFRVPTEDAGVEVNDVLCAGGDVDYTVVYIDEPVSASSSLTCDGPMSVDVIVGGETIGTVSCDNGAPFLAGPDDYGVETRTFRFYADDPADEVSYSFNAVLSI